MLVTISCSLIVHKQLVPYSGSRRYCTFKPLCELLTSNAVMARTVSSSQFCGQFPFVHPGLSDSRSIVLGGSSSFLQTLRSGSGPTEDLLEQIGCRCRYRSWQWAVRQSPESKKTWREVFMFMHLHAQRHFKKWASEPCVSVTFTLIIYGGWPK